MQQARRVVVKLAPYSIRAVFIIATVEHEPLPLPDESSDLVTAPHPVRPAWG